MLLYKKIKKKRPAFMLVSALLATLILMMIAHGFMLMYGGQFTYLQAAKTASEGQQYAELVGEKVKLEGIDAEEVTSKTNLDTLTGNDKDKDWQYTYEISDGTEDDNGNIFKVATIKIYKDGENSPRYTYEVPLSSLGSNLGEFGSNDKGYYWKLPNGLIFQWGYHNSGNYITFPIKFEHKCINVELTPSVTSWAGDERHPFIKEITNSYIRYEDRGVDQHYGLNPVYWSAFGN